MGAQDDAAEVEVRREWLVRCVDRRQRPKVCSIEANDGTVEIISPQDDIAVLEGREMREFRDSIEAAIRQAEADLDGR